MKRIIVLLLVLVLSCLAFASCDKIPDEVMDKVAPILEKVGVDVKKEEPAPAPAHEHDFVLQETVESTCIKAGKNTYKCECGEEKTETVFDKNAHLYKSFKTVQPNCTAVGEDHLACEYCNDIKVENFGEATGHNMAEFEEYSRMIPCTNDGCSYGVLPEGNGKYKEVLVYNEEKVQENVTKFEAARVEIEKLVKAAAKYDKDQHAYDENSELYQLNLSLEEYYQEFLDVLDFVTAQTQIAMLEYYMTGSAKAVSNYNYVYSTRTQMVADYYSFFGDIADSMYREYFFAGYTDEEIAELVGESDAVSDPEYTALVNRNNEIENEYLGLAKPESNAQVPVLYAELVANNKKIAEHLGYSNYYEYAYTEVYSREYDHTDSVAVYEYVKEYITPVYNNIYRAFKASGQHVDATYNQGSFFEIYNQNKALNDYIDLLTINGNKTVSFSDELNSLIGDGKCFIGGKAGTAYVTSINGADFDGSDLPIAYFSKTYANFFTVAHEFGHYMNEMYSGGMYNQSYDLLEMHSQGNEMLFLAYLNNNKGTIPSSALTNVNLYQFLNMFYAAVNAIAVDAFEYAVYTDYYEGPNAEAIMDRDDGSDVCITMDEYDLLFKSILTDLGVDAGNQSNYWRNAVVSSPCYYISYSTSALVTLQLLPMGTEDFDAASAAYLKLFSYVDEYENEGAAYMTTIETVEYAGLKTFLDEELYQDIYEYFIAKYPG